MATTDRKKLDGSVLSVVWSLTKNLVGGKVDKIPGKGLSENDYTDEDKNRVETIDFATVDTCSDIINELI